MFELAVLIISVFVSVVSRAVRRIKTLDLGGAVTYATDSIHFGVAYYATDLLIKGAIEFGLYCVIVSLYVLYQLVDYYVSRDSVDKDLGVFTSGVLAAIGVKFLS